MNQSVNQFITRHSTEARAAMSLSQTEKECLKSVLEKDIPHQFQGQKVKGQGHQAALGSC